MSVLCRIFEKRYTQHYKSVLSQIVKDSNCLAPCTYIEYRIASRQNMVGYFIIYNTRGVTGQVVLAQRCYHQSRRSPLLIEVSLLGRTIFFVQTKKIETLFYKIPAMILYIFFEKCMQSKKFIKYGGFKFCRFLDSSFKISDSTFKSWVTRVLMSKKWS